eukprot:c19107_g1_i2.p1 GENE.c19107_g1_i2~~c19107_g1_i2.p1  ORF type:complete len:470 (+),score=131.53 c19107_g1_i2:262-1671(+)
MRQMGAAQGVDGIFMDFPILEHSLRMSVSVKNGNGTISQTSLVRQSSPAVTPTSNSNSNPTQIHLEPPALNNNNNNTPQHQNRSSPKVKRSRSGGKSNSGSQSHQQQSVGGNSNSNTGGGGGGGVGCGVTVVELPTCAVCLERLDEKASGLLTTACNHTFHCTCLTKWKDSTCPVCRYVQEPPLTSQCNACEATRDLWMCLICGYIGCGRYISGHAVEHFLETTHAYALDLERQRVWDYVGDGWVHRIIQNNSDGKLVAVGQTQSTDQSRSEDGTEEVEGEVFEAMVQSKLDSISLEYTQLLTSQLERQRDYFEERQREMEAQMAKQYETLSAQLEASQAELATANTSIAKNDKQRRTLEKKIEVQNAYIERLKSENTFLKSINESMTANQDLWRQQIDATKHQLEERYGSDHKRIAELEEQVRDLMFALDTKQKVESSPHQQEIADGVMLVTQPQTPTRSSKSKNKRR